MDMHVFDADIIAPCRAEGDGSHKPPIAAQQPIQAPRGAPIKRASIAASIGAKPEERIVAEFGAAVSVKPQFACLDGTASTVSCRWRQ